MTGEITLSGLVLPVGGIREKALAARRHGIKTFILPARNEADLAELPPGVREGIHFVPVQALEEVLNVALPPRADRSVAAHGLCSTRTSCGHAVSNRLKQTRRAPPVTTARRASSIP